MAVDEKDKWWKVTKFDVGRELANPDYMKQIEEENKALIQEVTRLRGLVGEAKEAIEGIRPIPSRIIQCKAVRNLDEIYAECDKVCTKIAKLEGKEL